MQPSVLLVDDDENILTVLSMRLKAAGYRVFPASNGARALAHARAELPDAVVCDLRLEREDGLQLMEELHALDPALPVLILTAHGSIPNAVEAMRRGAVGYLTKPVDREELLAWLSRCVDGRRSQRPAAGAEFHGMVGESAAMKRVFEMLQRVAPTRSTVLLAGESGTGKELAARALHALSARAERPFVAVNCGALAEGLLQAELFGVKRGAFTDARQDRDGLFVRAHGGTLFLDEIGDVSPPMQAALLRALQSGEITPVGGVPIRVDVRILAATHKDLKAEVAAGRFREDLRFRLDVVNIVIPPLRERPEDVAPLAQRFLERARARASKPKLAFSQAAMAAMKSARWSGNVRELENAVERAVVLGSGPEILPEDLGLGGVEAVTDESARGGLLPLKEAREAWERDYLIGLLRSNGGNVSAAARQAGKFRADFYALLKRHSIEPTDYK